MTRSSLTASLTMIVLPASVCAETFLSGYGGFATTARDRIYILRLNSCEGRFPFRFCDSEEATRKVSFGTSFLIGGHLGHWSEAHSWLGIAFDVSRFGAAGDDAEVKVLATSLLLMLRTPVRRVDGLPNPRVHPYVAFGPTLFVTDYIVDFRPDLSRVVDRSAEAATGVDVRAGFVWQSHPWIALFGEIRHTFVKYDLSDFETELSTLYVVGGISLRLHLSDAEEGAASGASGAPSRVDSPGLPVARVIR